ncbi:MAG: polysaccharide biosynthesis protein [Pseudomonadales bacterium]|nr:polysaccharide biosynthesis protein [Pseudomonadales bacterium]
MRLQEITSIPRGMKRVIMLSTDFILLPSAIYIAYLVGRSNLNDILVPGFAGVALTTCLITFAMFASLGLYRAVIRFMGEKAVIVVVEGVSLSAGVLLFAQFVFFGKIEVPVLVAYWAILLVMVGGSRFVVRSIINSWARKQKEHVIIYGAGSSGMQLVSALRKGSEYEPVAIVDDKRSLQKSTVDGIRVSSPRKLMALVEKYNVSHVLLAIPSASQTRRAEILALIEPLPVKVLTIPGLVDLVSGKSQIEEVREVDVEELLGRDPVAPDKKLMDSCIAGKSVLVTGAGGSIGSELCRQIIQLKPKRLVLLDVCEFGLYAIEQEVESNKSENDFEFELIALLGNVKDSLHTKEVMTTFEIQTVYHAAAYKHVPMVEHNVVEGVKNNVFGTLYAAEAARASDVETFVLVSTDKAVRPTSVMGATKRLAELILQGLSQLTGDTTFCMVRFGNVLGSSGSVVPLFREQIKKGGPVTVTHPEIIRYFMTIPEAAQLVIQASALAEGGDVFVLDMGQTVKISELAKKMIGLMGLELKTDENPEGDIEIQYSGLRPGEKLFEELLIGDNVIGTEHPRIMRAEEMSLPWEDVTGLLSSIDDACEKLDCEKVRELLIRAHAGYDPHDDISDFAWCEASRTKALKVESAQVVSVFSKKEEKSGVA